ncbi:MAG: glycogen synthase GlgA [Azospirillaceae bacterium]
MRVLHVVSEVYPLIKTGGLADVAAALPAAQARLGAEARLLVPGYPEVMALAETLAPIAALPEAPGGAAAWLRFGEIEGLGVPAYVIDCPALYAPSGHPYLDEAGIDRPENPLRFGLLGRTGATLGAGLDAGWRPTAVHAHDWQAGLAPLHMALDRAAGIRAEDGGPPAASVITIHNLAYQGLFPAETRALLGLPESVMSVEGAEFHGKFGFLKAGLYHADRITTVSPTYAAEIRTPAEGCGLDGLLDTRAAEGRLVGILNGIDDTVWNPAADAYLPAPYDAADPAPKARSKAALQRRLGLSERADTPLFGIVARANRAKGLDMLLNVLPGLVSRGGQLALLLAGDRDLEQGFREAMTAWPDRVAGQIGYDESLSHLIQAGADCVLVPSRSEPCGLTQMYAMRYGSPPLVRRTGGLADTVVNAEPAAVASGEATGFVFDDPTDAALAGTLAWAMDLHRDADAWARIRQAGMIRDFGWTAPARQYLALYAAARADR